jgi:hypothetical protein
MIVGFFGFQRSGKTALAMLLSRTLNKMYGIEIYTNIDTYGSTQEISKLTDIPNDGKSKIFLWDEIHFSMDSRNISKNVDFTPFVSTLGKQKILLLYTCPTPDLVDKRIRKFTNHFVIAKGDKQNIYYQFVDPLKGNVSSLYKKSKNQKLFEYLNYNSDLVIPNTINANINDYISLSQKKGGCI